MFHEIKDLLGPPYFEIDDCLIYNADSLTILPKIKPKYINLTLTSPPYNIGKEYESVMPIQNYVDWCGNWMNLVYDLTADDGAFILNLGYLPIPQKGRAIPIPYLLWDKTPFYLQQEIVWHYEAGVASKNYLSPRNEKFLWYVRNPKDYCFNLDVIRDPNVKYPNQKKHGKLRCNPLGKNPSDVWSIPKVTAGKDRSPKERTSHPAQFPTEIVDRFILGMSNEGDVILDPFLGSGSTCISALKNNRKVIGIEISEEYCNIAANRVKEFFSDAQFQQMEIKDIV